MGDDVSPATDREMSARAIALAIHDVARLPLNTIAFNQAQQRLDEALDYYIARSSQGWCR